MKQIITPRPRQDNPTFGVNVNIAHPKGASEAARKQGRMQALAMLDDVIDFDEPVTIWFSSPAIQAPPAADGKEVTTVTLNVIGRSIERKFKAKQERTQGSQQ